MKPAYFIENAYSIYPGRAGSNVSVNYEVESAEGQFELQVLQLFHKGKKHLYHEEFSLAMDCFKEVSNLILKTVHPTLPPHPNANYWAVAPQFKELLNPMLERAGEIIRDTPVTQYKFPDSIVSKDFEIDPGLAEKLNHFSSPDLQITSHHGKVSDLLDKGVGLANKDNWSEALKKYKEALATVPASDHGLKASIQYDMALINEKLHKKDDALKMANESVKLFGAVKEYDKQVSALNMLSGMLDRNDKPELAKSHRVKADQLVKKHSLHALNLGSAKPIMLGSNSIKAIMANKPMISLANGNGNGNRPGMRVSAGTNAPAALADVEVNEPQLMTMKYIAAQPKTMKKTLSIQGQGQQISIPISGNLRTGMTAFYDKLKVTKDIGILKAYTLTHTQMVAYLPHMYFYVLPMAIADCEIGLGKLTKASERIEDVLKYPYLNENVEVVQVWTKLADCYMDLGDEKYKAARDHAASYGTAKEWYEKIVKSNNTINPNSPLYKDVKFAKIKQRVTSALSSGSFTSLNENPAILWRIRQAEAMLLQITNKFNYFGFDKDYIPPFSFEYLQETARYFAQRASQMEQKYIQYKSTAESEELRADQMQQQVELAQESVQLEQRGVDEAQAGINVSQANLNYAETRRKNAVDQANEFNAVRWELLEYSEAEAWANASSVDGDDQVKLSWNGNYYNSNKKKRNEVIKDLAYKKTRITHDLQANKLNDEIAAANAYKDVAQAQLAQANARKAVAEKRVEIAQLQQKHAEENREFLDLKEFGAGMWYKIAQRTKKIVTRYLDQATEIAFLMQRAYKAETERQLSVIRYDYSPSYSGFLVGADMLTRDIDQFTFDYITNIKTKKAPVKKTISLSDLAPNALEQLISTGKCQFETRLSDFDREFPGMYLCKVKNVEVVFVGITKAVSIAGSLRNLGVSMFRRSNGSKVARQYPQDVMPLSQYDIRQDALAFRFDPKELKLFENNGLETIWEMQLRKDANDFNLRDILDIHLIIYYDGFHDTTLEDNVIQGLPASGNASRAVSMQLYFPDELYYLRNNGEGIMQFDTSMFPANQTDLKRGSTQLKILGAKESIKNLTLTLESSDKNKTITIKTDADGKVPASKFTQLKNGAMTDQWTITIPEAENQHLIKDDRLDLSGIQDLIFLTDYTFKYQS